MAAIDKHASQEPHHTGDLDAMLRGIERDPLLRQTITVVLILDRAPDREVLLDRLERGSLICKCGSTAASVHPLAATHVLLQPEAFGPESASIPSSQTRRWAIWFPLVAGSDVSVNVDTKQVVER